MLLILFIEVSCKNLLLQTTIKIILKGMIYNYLLL